MIGETILVIGGLLFLLLVFGFSIRMIIAFYQERDWGWLLAFLAVLMMFIGLILEEAGI